MDIFYIVLLILIGFILIFLEIIILPGLITGIIGAMIVLITLIFSFFKFGVSIGLLALLFSLILIVLLFFIIKKFNLWGRFILRHNQLKELGYISNPDLANLVGKKGVTVTDLRPSGIILINGVKHQAQSEGEFIPANSKIEVIKTIGQTIIVKIEEEGL